MLFLLWSVSRRRNLLNQRTSHKERIGASTPGASPATALAFSKWLTANPCSGRTGPFPPWECEHTRSRYSANKLNDRRYLVHIIHRLCSLIVNARIRKLQLQKVWVTEEGEVAPIDNKLHVTNTDLLLMVHTYHSYPWNINLNNNKLVILHVTPLLPKPPT